MCISCKTFQRWCAGMVQIRIRKLFFIYVTVTIVGFIWFYSTYDVHDCKVKEIEELLEWYKSKTSQLQKNLDNSALELREWQRNSLPKKGSIIPTFPFIYVVTPTHDYPEQKANLVTFYHTLLNVKNVHWIIIEDSYNKTNLVSNILRNSGIPFTHLNVLTPPAIKMKQSDPTWLKPKGVLQRNAAIQWIRENINPHKQHGVVYFADDDNTYSLEVFEEMRFTKTVTVWPVGLVGGLRYEKPIVKDGKVTGWFVYWKPQRPFPMDMAGFAINVQLFFDSPNAKFSNEVPRGYLESTILEQLHVKMEDLEPRADNCTKVLVWHTRTEKTKLDNEKKMMTKYGYGSDTNVEV